MNTAEYQVYAAWNNPGPMPNFHRRAQERLRREWPTLANALDALEEETPNEV